jgi:N-carbamoylputrescine amidase
VQLIKALQPPVSWARVREPETEPVRVALVQHRWLEDPAGLRAQLDEGIAMAAETGAQVVFLPELTLSRYPADQFPDGDAARLAEEAADGPSAAFARAAATRHGIHVHISLFERADGPDGLGYNTSMLVGPDGSVVGSTRKMHIPLTEGYHENAYFRPGPATGGYPVLELADPSLRLGMPDLLGRVVPRRWRGCKPSVARSCWSTRPRSAPSPTTPTSTPSRCGAR